MKSVGQASRLETQTEVDITVLSLKFVGLVSKLEIQQGFLLQS